MSLGSTAELPDGLILIAHEVLGTITDKEMIAALPDEYRTLPRHTIRLDAVKAELRDLAEFDWASAWRKTEADIQSKLSPLMEKHPSYRLAYFGLAPIGLAMRFGHWVGGMLDIDVYQKRHDRTDWLWDRGGQLSQLNITSPTLGTERITAEGDVVLRLSLSHRIDPSETASLFPESLGEYDLALAEPNEDALCSPEDLALVKVEFDKIIDWLHRFRPQARIHVFAAVTVGEAVVFGLSVNPTIHSPVHSYQYSKSRSPRYSPALILQTQSSEAVKLTEGQISGAAALRPEIALQLASMQEQAKPFSADGNWLGSLLGSNGPFYGPITGLANIRATELMTSSVDLNVPYDIDGFHYDPKARKWQFSDDLLAAIRDYLLEDEDVCRAIRLLILHENVHIASQGFTSATALQIRRFPKILEELDYHADVWAFIHEWRLSGGSPDTARQQFIAIVDTALKTFLAFDANTDASRVEIRRLNRYLIWFWQLLRLERCHTLDDVLDVLAEKPLIEIAGPRVISYDGRSIYLLDDRHFDEPELAVLVGLRLHRHGQAPGSRVRDILNGFRSRNEHTIIAAMRGIFDQVAP
jgi:hypothetical protein